MKHDMPNISYERSMNHNYMVLSKCDFFGKKYDREKDYRAKMLLENRIPGLLPVTHRLMNGESKYYYEINSLQSLDRLCDKNEIGYDMLKKLLSGCVSLFDKLEEYLLDGTQIIINAQFIYINVEKTEPYFVCYPEYEGDVRLSFMEFIDELLTKIDHTDEQAVMLGYQVFRYTRNPNYVISEIGHMIEGTILKKAESKQFIENPENVRYVNNVVSDYATDKVEPAKIENRQELEYSYTPTVKKESTNQKNKSESIGDLIGGIFCVFVAFCAGFIILGAKILNTFQLSGNNELYLYGAMAMAGMAAVLFFSCYIKKRKQDKEIAELGISEEENGEQEQYFSQKYNDSKIEYAVQNPVNQKNILCGALDTKSYEETVYLGDSIVEERILYGRINGRDIHISLDKLPMTVGKLASVSDYVINDTAVSKMHARFEERDGRVYVCDLNSTNGTVKNGVLLGVNQSVVLEPGDKLRFGRTSFTYC